MESGPRGRVGPGLIVEQLLTGTLRGRGDGITGRVLLTRCLADIEAGGLQPLEVYQRAYPDHTDVVAEE